MNNSMNSISGKNIWQWLLVAYLTLLSTPGWAAISGTVQPASITIPLAQSTTMTVTWVVTTSSSPAPTFVMSSSSGQFIIPGPGLVLGTVNTLVSSVYTGPVGAPATVIITEIVSVPQQVSALAIRAGVSTIAYQRIFSDGTTSGLVAANIQIGGSAAGQFAISRMALQFDDGAIVRVVPLKSRLSATANVSYNGSGMFTGYWEVADPGSTAGTPIFTQLQPVAQGLGGIDQVKMSSQTLPTERQGLYMVRLRVTAPLPSFEPPVLYYYVGEPKSGTAFAFMPMTVMNPPSQAYVDSATQFAWQPVSGARAYMIEIFSNPEAISNNLPDIGGAPAAEDPQLIRRALSRPPMAGMLVAGNQTQTTLSASTRAKLQHQHSYFWRIQAIGADGTTVGEAQVREIRIP
jgi:hypothetical protein